MGAEKKEREIFTSGRPGHSATSGTVIDSSGGVGEVSRAVRYGVGSVSDFDSVGSGSGV